MINFEEEVAKDIATQEEIYTKNVAFIQKLCRKYFGLGKSMGGANASAVDFISEVQTILEETRQAQLTVEQEVENLGLVHMKQNNTGEFSQKLIAQFDQMTKEVDRKHGALIAERNAKLAALKEKYSGILPADV